MIRSAIDVTNVTKSFNDVQAVKGISLQVPEGQFFSLLGPSGCGKTTLLRMIAGFEQPTTGSITIGGKEMAGVPPHKRPVNMVFQSYALFPHLTVFDNVAFGLKANKQFPTAEIPQRVTEALNLVQLPAMAKRYPRELSGGQQQRIAFARAIVNKPFVLLLDEPLSALDPRIRQEMQSELARFKKELGITFVMVTHDQSEAFALSDQIAVFNAGEIEQIGSPQEIYAEPKTAFVADFIGHTNVFKATVLEVVGSHVRLRTQGGLKLSAQIDAPAPARQQTLTADHTSDAAAFAPNQSVVVWIRMDSIGLCSDNHAAASADRNVFDAALLHRSYQGASEELLVQVGDLKLTAAVRNSPSADATGEVRLSVKASDVHVLPDKDAAPMPVSPAVSISQA